MASRPVAWPSPSSPAVASVCIGGVLALAIQARSWTWSLLRARSCAGLDILHDDDDLFLRLSVTVYQMARPSEGRCGR